MANMESYRQILSSIPGKLLRSNYNKKYSVYLYISGREKVIIGNQHRSVKNKLCQISLISYSDRVSGLVAKGNVVNITYLDFSEAFDRLTCHSHK